MEVGEEADDGVDETQPGADSIYVVTIANAGPADVLMAVI